MNILKSIPFQHVSVDPVNLATPNPTLKPRKEKTLAEKAERYASWIASLINGVSPAVGGLLLSFRFSLRIQLFLQMIYGYM
ncbi:MAG: hypothetical protein EU530_04590 [Promethearchaeota archaeon]|nr:MAG: hypothetical protein EU530_04590 [Candidatus Lokiarchaeota archaeon]